MVRLITPKMNPLRIAGRALIFTVLFLLSSLQVISAQGWGWTLWIGIPADNMPNPNVSIPHLPEFVGDDIVIAAGFPHHTITEYHYFYANEGQLSAGAHTTDNFTVNFFPQSTLMFAEDSLLVLSQRVLLNSERADAYLGRHYRQLGGEPEGVYDEFLVPILENPDQDIRAEAMAATIDDKAIVTGTITTFVADLPTTKEAFLLKTDRFANVEWVVTFPFPEQASGVQVVPQPDGSYFLLANSPTVPWLLKTDASGNLLWEMPLNGLGNAQAEDMIRTANGDLVVTGSTALGDLFVLRLDDEGEELWQQIYWGAAYETTTGRGILEDEEGDLLIAGRATPTPTGRPAALLAKLRADGTPLWERTYGGQSPMAQFNDIVLTPGGQYMMGGELQFYTPASERSGGYVVKTDTFGIVKGGLIKGKVFWDENTDCLADSTELPLENWVVRAVGDSLTFFGRSDAQGHYRIPVDVLYDTIADYTVTIIPPTEYWQACANDVLTTMAYQDSAVVDFPMEALVECPFLYVDIIGAQRFRPCDTTTIFLEYCNYGTASADSAQLVLSWPDELELLSSSLPVDSSTDSTLTFQLGSVSVNACGQFTIEAAVVCDESLIDEVVCLDAHIYPDSLCTVPGSPWGGALVYADYTCEEGDVQFRITNIGSAPTSETLEYVIIEDAVLLLEGSFDLNPDEEFLPDPLTQNAATYTLLAQQEPNAPGAPLLSVGADACDTDGQTNLNEFEQYSGNPFTDSYCQRIVGPYNPYNLQAAPTGLGEEHAIQRNTAITYTIRFQNTGRDTAFRVVIRDTLSPQLDFSTLRVGAASHPYTWHFEDNVLVFNFHYIDLPDSLSNPSASQGFVNFHIKQQPDLPSGTIIEHQAAVYFNFNLPIFTNRSFHTVIDFFDVINEGIVISDPDLALSVAPNPMLDAALITLEGGDYHGQRLRLELFNVAGQPVQQLESWDAQFSVERRKLASGLYLFQISNDEGILATGKLVAQ